MFRTLEPNLTASSVLCDTCIIFNLGFLPIIHAGKYIDANSDLVCLGGMFIMSLPFFS